MHNYMKVLHNTKKVYEGFQAMYHHQQKSTIDSKLTCMYNNESDCSKSMSMYTMSY